MIAIVFVAGFIFGALLGSLAIALVVKHFNDRRNQ